jgi:hypothetical protein
MPYAPEEGLRALWFQPLSFVHSLSRQGNWSSLKPLCSMIAQPILRLPLYWLQEVGIGPVYGFVAESASSSFSSASSRFLRLAASAAFLARAASAFAAAAAFSAATR